MALIRNTRSRTGSFLREGVVHREALEILLAVIERNRGAHGERARQDMLALFKLLGDDAELSREYRPRLAALLF